jgi:hypothetical protein
VVIPAAAMALMSASWTLASSSVKAPLMPTATATGPVAKKVSRPTNRTKAMTSVRLMLSARASLTKCITGSLGRRGIR